MYTYIIIHSIQFLFVMYESGFPDNIGCREYLLIQSVGLKLI